MYEDEGIENTQELKDIFETESDVTGDDTDYIVILEKLIRKGKKQGYLTVDEIKDEIKKEIPQQNTEILEKIRSKLEEFGIDVVEDQQAANDGSDGQKVDDDSDVDDISHSDSVRVYLREIGRIPLLTMENEVRLAKGIAESKEAVKSKYEAEMMSFFTEQKKEDIYESLKVAEKRSLTDDVLLEINEKVQEILADEATQKEISKNVHKALEFKRDKRYDHKLLEANLRLVVSIAKKYIGKGLDFLDIIQEGNLGLIEAVDKFDYRKGFKFSTYATFWIRETIKDAIEDQGHIKIPRSMKKKIAELICTRQKLVQELGRKPTSSEVAEKMGLSRKKVEEIQEVQKNREIAQNPRSLQEKIKTKEDNSDLTIGDTLEDKHYSHNPSELLEQLHYFDNCTTLLKEAINKIHEPHRSKILDNLPFFDPFQAIDVIKNYSDKDGEKIWNVLLNYIANKEPKIANIYFKEFIPNREEISLEQNTAEDINTTSWGDLTHKTYNRIIDIDNWQNLDKLDKLLEDLLNEIWRLEKEGKNPFILKLVEYLQKKANDKQLNNEADQVSFLQNLFNNKLGLQDESTKKNIRNWIYGKSDKKNDNKKKIIPEVESIYLICFALEMNVEEVKDFFVKGCLGRAFNLKNYREAVYYYCFYNKFPYKEALEIIEEIEAKRQTSIESQPQVAGDNLLTTYTRTIETHIKTLQPNRQDLIDYLVKHNYSKNELHKTVTDHIVKYFRLCCQLLEVDTAEDLFRKIFNFNTGSHEKDSTIGRRLPKILKQVLPTADHLNDILNGQGMKENKHITEDKYRRMLIFLTFTFYYYNLNRKMVDHNQTITDEDFNNFESYLNGELATCGYLGIYPRHPFDLVILCLARQKNPISALRAWYSEASY